jgi:transposase
MVEQVSEEILIRVQELAGSDNLELSRRAQIILLTFEERSDAEISQALGISRKTAWRWRSRFRESGLEGIERERPRTGRKPRRREEVSQRIIETTLSVSPPEGRSWSTRRLAQYLGVSRAMVHRVWRKYGITPPVQTENHPPTLERT